MAAPSKIQDEAEVKRWFEDGKTYRWMIEEYRRKYNIETSVSMWGNVRKRLGYDRRTAWDEDLIPWAIKPEHRYKNILLNLRKEARRRAGFQIGKGGDYTVRAERDLDSWIEGLKEGNLVVHYDPDTEDGWFYVPRREGIDNDLIREPPRKTGKHRTG